MKLLWPLSSLRITLVVVVICSEWSSAEKHLLCSKDSIIAWYEYEGPVYYHSFSMSPCLLNTTELNINYTVIPMFTIVRAGANVVIYYKNQYWVEISLPIDSCTNLKICHIIKGETIHDSVTLPLKHYTAVEGEYKVLLTIDIIDDLDREIRISVSLTVQVKSDGSESEPLRNTGGA